MKTTTTLFVLSFLLIISFGCSTEDPKAPAAIETADLMSNDFTQAQSQIQERLDQIFTSIHNREADELISYHAYGPKFTEFKDGDLRTSSVENEAFERGLVGAITGFGYYLHDLKIDVFGNVGKVTFNAEFIPEIGGVSQPPSFSQATLIFVKDKGEWRIVHEHLSALNEEAIAVLNARNNS